MLNYSLSTSKARWIVFPELMLDADIVVESLCGGTSILEEQALLATRRLQRKAAGAVWTARRNAVQQRQILLIQ
jgi:hypothetical protein